MVFGQAGVAAPARAAAAVLVALAMVVVVAVAAASGAAAQCCNTQPINVCPPQSTFGADRPVVCSSFGDVHVHTFDGVAYEAQSFGEFYLTRPYNASDATKAPLTVQARMAACDNSALNVEPSAAATGNAGVCNKGFAMSDGLKVLEFVHDRNADDLVVKIDGVRYPYITSLVQLGFIITVNSRGNTGFNVMVVYTRGDIVNMKFFASGTASISIYQRPAVWGTVGGLCGFHDGCAGNDFFVRPDSPYAPNDSTPPSPITVSTVTSPDDTITPLPVLAGSLAPGLMFVNRTAAPADRDNHFVSSWRVPRRESLFTYDHGENYNLRFWKGLYITPSASQVSAAHQAGCRFLGYNMPSFLLSACESDYVRHTALTGSPSSVVGEVQREMLFDYCSYFCTTSLFPFAHVDLHIGHCNGVCQYADGNTDLHGAYGTANLPPVVFSNENTNKAKITSTLNLAGTYTVRLSATDRCETRQGNVTLNIACVGGFTPASVSVSPSQHTVERGWYGFPTVYFHGHAPAAAHRVSWKMIRWPGQDDLVSPVPRPDVAYSLSRHAAFQPVKAGNYTLQFAVYDGCHIFTSEVTVIAACSACQGSANMALYPLKYLIWGMYFTSAESGPLLAPQPTGYQPLQLVANDPFRLGYQWTHDWLITDDNNPLSNFTQVNKTHPDPKHKQYIVNHFADYDVANLSREFPDGRVISFETLPEQVTLNVSTTATYGPPIKDVGHVGPVGTQFGVFPPQLMFNRTRDATRTSLVRTMLIETRNVTVTVFADSFPWCRIDLLNSDVTTATLTATPLITSTIDERFVRGQGCVGEYNLQLAVGEPECVTTRDSQSVEVTCGPPPQCFVSCPESMTFDYRNKVFPPVTIKGSASSDPYGRGPLHYLWYFVNKPETSARVNSDLCTSSDEWGCTNADSTWVPDIDGHYEVLLSVSNGCNNASAYSQLLVECPYPWISPKFDMDETIDYRGVPPIVARLDATDSVTSAKVVGGTLSYSWSVKRSTDSRPLPVEALPFIPAPVLSGGGASPLATLTVFATGKYDVTLTATHGCNQSASITQSTLTTCAASLFPVPGPDQQVLYSNSSFSWPAVALNGSGSYATSSSYTPTLAYLWVVDGTIVGQAAEISFTPVKTGVNVVTLIINDGCNWAAKSMQVRAFCRQLISNPQIVPGSPVDSGTVLALKGEYSTGIILSYNWTLEFAPANNEAYITNPNQATAAFTPQLAGKYGVRLCISDGCHQDCKTINLEVACVNPLSIDPVVGLSSWSFNPSKMSKHLDVYWRANRFVQVAMSADGSTIGARNHTNPEFKYTWTVKRAPQQSLFEAIQTETSIPTFNWTAVINTTDHNVTVTNTTSWMTTVVTTTSSVKLSNSALINPHAWWPACFYPDLAGEYEIELRVVDYCLAKAESVFVTAHCSDAPVAVVDVLPAAGWVGPSYLQTSGRGDSRTRPQVDVTLTLDRNSWRRVRLNGQPSIAYNNSQLSYYWSWNDTERANTKHAQDGIELPYSAQASILVPRAGVYRLAFYVHDGCAWSSVGVTITAKCADETALSFVDGTRRTYTYNVPAENAVAVTTFPLAEKTTCASSNDVWSLVDFKSVVVPVPDSDKTDAGVIVGAVLGGLAGVVIVAGVIACFVKKRRAQSSPRGSHQLIGEDMPSNSQDIYAPPPVALGPRGSVAAAPAAPGGADVAAVDNVAV